MVKTTKFGFPKTTLLAFLDFLIDYLTEVKCSKVDSDALNCVPIIREDLIFLRSFSGKMLELRDQQRRTDLEYLLNLAVEATYKIEFLIDQLVLGDIHDSFSESFESVTEEIAILKKESLKVFDDSTQEIGVEKVSWTSSIDQELLKSSTSAAADDVVGFETEISSIIDRLTRGSKKLQVVAIVGMPGSGKTTLATKVYNDPKVAYHFHVRAYVCNSQVFIRRKVLLELLAHIRPGENYYTMNDDDMSQQLWRFLKGRRYLIFIDDIWDTQALDCLKQCFPDDCTESRILLTSRNLEVAKLDEEPHLLRQLTVNESMELLQKKLFLGRGSDWTPALRKLGMEVAEYCKGLPLTVVIVAGLLQPVEQDVWEKVLKSLRSGIISTTDKCISTIELSYKHLPDHLKPCFLSFGGFPEDHRFSVKRLIWLWIAEGFVRKTESKCLEEVARDYLNDLIGRSLVINVERGSAGGVKACRIHDLLHDFCVKKAKEDNFLYILKDQKHNEKKKKKKKKKKDQKANGKFTNLRRLCIYSKLENFMKWEGFCPRLRTLLFFHPREHDRWFDMSFLIHVFKLLRVLDMDEVELAEFPSEIAVLVQLRYLAIQVGGFVSPEIGKLSNLETLILNIRPGGVRLPYTLRNLQKLRHLYTKGHFFFELPISCFDRYSCNMLKLEILSTLYGCVWSIMEKQLRKFPNIRRMKCKLYVDKDCFVNESKGVDFSFLSHPESLSLSLLLTAELNELIFPKNIKKLTLYGCYFPWSKISSIAKLPYLEVLKLLSISFPELAWHVEDGEFAELKFLKLEDLYIAKWTAASDDQFPNLEKLVLSNCPLLEEIPECLENAATLEMVEIRRCRKGLVSQIRKLEECQKDMGNSVLRVHEGGTDEDDDRTIDEDSDTQ